MEERGHICNSLHAELFPGHCTEMLDTFSKSSNLSIRNFKLLFHHEEVCQFKIKVYIYIYIHESCSEITEGFIPCLYFTVKHFNLPYVAVE